MVARAAEDVSGARTGAAGHAQDPDAECPRGQGGAQAGGARPARGGQGRVLSSNIERDTLVCTYALVH